MAEMKIISSKEISQDFYLPRKIANDVHDIVQGIIDSVRKDGDQALHQMSEKFDQAAPKSLLIDPSDLASAAEKLQKENPELFAALSYTYKLTFDFAKQQRNCFTDFETELAPGLITGQKTIAVERAGLYAPAGRFPLFSTLIMCAAPAKAAGAKEVVLCTPPRRHPVNPDLPWADENIMAAAHICGITKVFACGGAQSVAAMAYGTASVPRCDVIVGPGNKFVQEAKRILYGTVGIDFVAGPTEAFVVADDSANPAWVAADLLAQAEHDADAQAVLVTTSRELAQKVADQVDAQLAGLATRETALASVRNNGLIIVAQNLDEAAEIANRKAPEHLEVAFDHGTDRDYLLSKVHNYGTLFVGHYAAEVLGDYAAGLNHVLPTSGSARFTGGLSVRHFIKTVTTLRTEENPDGSIKEGVVKSAQTADVLGRTEGLEGHAAAARARL